MVTAGITSVKRSMAARYDYLDGLRGLAIVGVVATHVGQAVHGLPIAVESFMIWGLRGVHLFFIVSSFTLLLVTNSKTFEATSFYTRRFFRIAPMFYIAAILYTLTNWTKWMSVAHSMPTGLDVVLTFIFLHGLNPHGINNVVPGGWSIACEATFYALFPLILPYAGRVRYALLIASAALALTVSAFTARLLLKTEFAGPVWDDFFHFNFAMNAWPFGLGVLVFALFKRFGDDRFLLALCGPGRLLCLSALLIIACISDRLPAGELLYAPVLAMFVFTVVMRPDGPMSSPAMIYLGHISFSLYLVHFAVLFVLDRIFPYTGVPLVDLVLLYTLALGGSAFLASAFYHGVEQPMIALGRKLTRKSRATSALPNEAR